MFVGVQGSGKTATARHIALILQREGYNVLSIKNINDIETYCDPQNPQVFVIDDVLGKFGLDTTMYNILKKYEDTLIKPKMSKTKVLMTCRELVYRNEKLSKYFLCQEDSVVLLNNEDNALNDNDKLEMLARYQLELDMLSSTEIKSSSNMFPFLCKIYSSKQDFKDYGSKFFISPVPCILDELDNMSTESKKLYASLVLLTVSQNKLSKDILENTNSDNESNVIEKKKKILEACKVGRDIENFKIIAFLSEMEGTFTRKFGSEFTFVHDSMFEIVAYHFGRRFQGLIIQYMSSDYVAHYIRLDTSEIENRESEDEETRIDNKQIKTVTVKDSMFDLYIKLDGSHHKALAKRLYRDAENGELYNVFGNAALKHPSVVQAFIKVMAEKPYQNCIPYFFRS